MWPVRSAVGNDAALVSNPGQFGMEVQEIRVEGAGCQAQDFRFLPELQSIQHQLGRDISEFGCAKCQFCLLLGVDVA